jgi:cell shape-determining protein MreC
LFLQDNIPVAYQMIAKKIYMPLIIENKQKVPGLFFDRTYLHLIKIQEIISYGEDSGNFVKFYYSNLNPVFIFVKNMKDDKIKSEFTNDENYQFEKKLNETIEIKVKLEKVQKNYKEKEQALKRKLRKYKSNY